MPLLTSPIDGSPMKQINRYGIEIDVCPATGGIWLDRGELEKLMAILKEESINDQHIPYRQNPEAGHYRSHHRDDDYDDDKRYAGNYKRKSKVSRMMDIFDF